MSVKVGSFVLSQATGNQKVFLGAKPSLVKFYTNRRTNYTAAGNGIFAFGATDGTNEFAGSVYSVDDVTTSDCYHRFVADACVSLISSTGDPVLEANIDSFNADGFTLNITTADAFDVIVYYQAFFDVSARVGTFDLDNSGQGNTQEITGVGFQGKVLELWNSLSGTTEGGGSDCIYSIGAATGSSARYSIANYSEDNVGTSNAARMQHNDALLSAIDSSGTVWEVDFDSWTSGGFKVYKEKVDSSSHRIGYVVIDCDAKVGTYTEPASATTKVVTGMGFKPVGLCLMNVNAPNENTLTASSVLSFGLASNNAPNSSEVGFCVNETDNVGTTVVSRNMEQAQIISMILAAGTDYITGNIDSWDSDGFTIDYTLMSDASERERYYVAYGFDVGFDTSDYSKRIKVTIDKDDVDSDLTNYSFILTHEAGGSQLDAVNGPLDKDGTGPCAEYGGDIRFTSDEAGTTQLACDIRVCHIDDTPANGILQVVVKVPSVSSSVDTDIYMWYGASDKQQPAEDDTYGQYNAYRSDYHAVWPLNEYPSAGKTRFADRTSNQNHGEEQSTGLLSVAGKVGNCVSWSAYSPSNYIKVPDDDSLSFGDGSTDTAFQVELCMLPGSQNDFRGYYSKGPSHTLGEYHGGVHVSGSSNLDYNRKTDNSTGSWRGRTSNTGRLSGTWYHHVAQKGTGTSYTTFNTYKNGALDNGNTADGTGLYVAMENTSNDLDIGRRGTAVYWDGYLDEFRIHQTLKVAGEVNADYENQFNPSTFSVASSPTDVTPSVGVVRSFGYIIG